MKYTPEQARRVQTDNMLFGSTMELQKKFKGDQWNPLTPKNATGRVWRSNKFLACEYKEPCGTIRISVNKTNLKSNLTDWEDGITWDDLMKIKHDIGYGDKCAVELLPADSDIVNVANMRHFFILDNPPEYMWKK